MIVESDVDWEEEGAQSGASTSAVIESVEAPAEVDDDNSDTDVTAALTKAQQVFNFVEVSLYRQGTVVEGCGESCVELAPAGAEDFQFTGTDIVNYHYLHHYACNV